MTAKELYRSMKQKALKIEDKEHEIIYVSPVTSKYMRNQVKRFALGDIRASRIDHSLGIISQEEMEKEVASYEIVIKSLDWEF